MNKDSDNIFNPIPRGIDEESIEVLLEAKNVRIERIVSKGHASPPGFWYDQDKDEFVVLLKGSAGLMFEDKDEITALRPGDYINIQAHVRHRVEWTDPHEDTVWMAVYY